MSLPRSFIQSHKESPPCKFWEPEINYKCNYNLSVITVKRPISQCVEIAASLGVDKFIVVLKPKVGKFNPKVNPFDFSKEVKTKLMHHSGIDYIEYTRNGAITVFIKTAECAVEFLGLKYLREIEIEPYLPIETISSRFVINCISTQFTLEDVANEFFKLGIYPYEIRRFLKNVPGSPKVPTESILVTILGHEIPEEVKLFKDIYTAFRFVDKPQQCLKCWRFDHITYRCKYPKRCAKCSGPHDLSKCTAAVPACANCKKSHFATYKKCTSLLQEKVFMSYKAFYHLPMREARKRCASEYYVF